MAVNQVINSYFPSLNNPVLSWSETCPKRRSRSSDPQITGVSGLAVIFSKGGSLRSKMSTNSVKHIQVWITPGECLPEAKPGTGQAAGGEESVSHRRT